MNRKPKCSGISQLSELGKKYVMEEWQKVALDIDWKYISIFDAIEGIIYETPESCSMIYEIPSYYTKTKIPHVIHFEQKHFIWE